MSIDDLKRAATFTGLAFVVSWAAFYGLSPLVPRNLRIALYVVFMFGPIVAALLTAARFDRGRVIAMLALRPRFNLWWIVAWGTPVAIAGAAWAVSLLMPGVSPRPFADGLAAAMAESGLDIGPELTAAMPHPLLVVAQAAIFGGLINTFFAIGEEAGWRGYLWTVLRPWGFWKATALTGVVWGVWHAPVIVDGHNYGFGYDWWPWMGIAMMTAFTLGLSPLLGLLRDRAGTSWAPALAHGTINAVGGLVVLGLAGGNPLVVGIAGVAGVIVLLAVSSAVALTSRDGAGPV